MTTTFKIPEPFEWNKTFEVGYPNLDEMHKITFMAITDMCNHPDDKMKLDCVISMIHSTCLMEEIMLKCVNHPDLTNHKMTHDNFMMKLKGLCCPLKTDDIHYCKEWLVNHIMTIDMKYKNKLYTYPNMSTPSCCDVRSKDNRE